MPAYDWLPVNNVCFDPASNTVDVEKKKNSNKSKLWKSLVHVVDMLRRSTVNPLCIFFKKEKYSLWN